MKGEENNKEIEMMDIKSRGSQAENEEVRRTDRW
jgi:hypothetical protein